MQLSRRIIFICALCALLSSLLLAGCATDTNTNAPVNSNAAPPIAASTPATQTLSLVERPQKVKDMMAARGAQDEAKPVLKIVQPADGSTVNG